MFELSVKDAAEEAKFQRRLEEARQEYLAERAVRPSVEELQKEWDALSWEDQSRIYDRFAFDCIGSGEPSDYWYDLLMPMMLDGYVGD